MARSVSPYFTNTSACASRRPTSLSPDVRPDPPPPIPVRPDSPDPAANGPELSRGSAATGRTPLAETDDGIGGGSDDDRGLTALTVATPQRAASSRVSPSVGSSASAARTAA